MDSSLSDNTPVEMVDPDAYQEFYDTTANDDELPAQLFKIEIEKTSGLLGYGQVKNLLTKKLNLNYHRIKFFGKPSKTILVSFKCEEDQEEALIAVNNCMWKDTKLCAKKASPKSKSPVKNTNPVTDASVQQAIQKTNTLIQEFDPMADPLVANSSSSGDVTMADVSEKKRKADLSTNPEEVKKAKTNFNSDRFISSLVRQATTPLSNMPYELQLAKKEKDTTKFLTKLTTELTRVNPSLKEKYSQESGEESLCCPLLPIIGSPETSAYCNKCEFSVGLHPESGRPVVGFNFSCKNFDGKCVAEACNCNHISPIMIKAAELFQAYLRVSSLPVYNPKTYEGFWRQLRVRTSQKGHLLLIVVVHPQNLSEEEMEERKMKLKAFFSASDLGVTSFYFQKSAMMDNSSSYLQHIYGTTYIEEELLGQTFRISPDASFPSNTSGTEVLVTMLKEFASLTKQTTILHLCCGTGAISISLAGDVSRVIGVDSCQAAIEDVWYNVRRSGIHNVEFICGKAEEVLQRVLSKLDNEEDMILILEQPKTGLINRMTRSLRTIPGLKRIVYLADNQQSAMANYLDLCRPVSNNYKGEPFHPVKAVPVDLFPQTNSYELILLFERQ